MIVYGDASELARPSVVLERIRAELRCVERDGVRASQERLRTALLLAGQLEQAAFDKLPEIVTPRAAREQAAALQALTARLADGLLAAWTAHGDSGRGPALDDARLLASLARAIDGARSVHDALLPLKTVEGTAFYALYPEQYIEAARQWVGDHASAAGKAAVVGIRSAGSALAAVVSAVLRAAGRSVATLSTRPFGHPFARKAELDRGELEGARFGLVVDEGPGMSGSSLASVGEALEHAGLARADISLFPGHDQPPKRFFSDEVRAFWARTRRYVVPIERVRLGGLPLCDALAASVAVDDRGMSGKHCEDFSAGRWRSAVYPSQHEWPAVCAAFERPKLRVARGGRRLLFQFAGLGHALDGATSACERFVTKLRQRADAGFAPAPVASAHGFVAVPWVEARPLGHRDLDAPLIERIGQYIAAVAEAPLAQDEQSAAVERLKDMLYTNVAEALGEDAAQRARALCERTARELPATPQVYGDGRLSPHQWLRTLAGRTLKVGGVCRDHDHTIVGRQAVLWDVAGAGVEWGLDAGGRRALLAAYKAAGGELASAPALRFYELAYSAFRAGQVSLCASSIAAADPEHGRLQRAYGFYRAEIERLLFAAR